MDEILLAATLSAYTARYNTKLFELAEPFGCLKKLYAVWHKKPTSVPKEVSAVLAKAWQEKQLQTMAGLLRDYKIHTCLFTDPSYPYLLKEIPDKPYVLYWQGDFSILSQTNLSCVGTRMMSSYGKRAISTLFNPLKGYPICMISGLALGIDGEVHRTALRLGFKTAAILGAGLDRYEPTTHDHLAREILMHDGCVISEYPPGVRPQKHHFLERNRIIAGLSQATVVIEGKHHSGSLVTARNALTYGREVGVVPGDIFLANSEGPLRLLREGAWPIITHDDILAMLGIEQAAHTIKEENHGQVYFMLKEKPVSIDALAAGLSLSIAEIRQQVTLLELEGLIHATATGEYFILK
jgi:DNA processing protein